MCFFMGQNQPLKKVEERFDAKVDEPDDFLQSDYIVGFEFLNVPVITNENEKIIQTDYHWGLLPSWTKDIDFRKNTLNARIETIEDKPSFKNIIKNRCLIISSGYYEWHWNDEKGKSKQKYLINSQDNEIFAFAGIYDKWINVNNGDVIKTFSIITTHANKTMEYIHNHKKRMPIILHQKDELNWLNGNINVNDLAYPKYDVNLIAMPSS